MVDFDKEIDVDIGSQVVWYDSHLRGNTSRQAVVGFRQLCMCGWHAGRISHSNERDVLCRCWSKIFFAVRPMQHDPTSH